MTPNEVQAMAERVEKKNGAETHPLLGVDTNEDKLEASDLPPIESMHTEGEALPQFYCDSCGHVGSHASGCPEAARQELERMSADEMDAEPEAEVPTRRRDPEVLPLAKQLVGVILRRVARWIDPE
jgi:hypothetical protein